MPQIMNTFQAPLHVRLERFGGMLINELMTNEATTSTTSFLIGRESDCYRFGALQAPSDDLEWKAPRAPQKPILHIVSSVVHDSPNKTRHKACREPYNWNGDRGLIGLSKQSIVMLHLFG